MKGLAFAGCSSVHIPQLALLSLARSPPQHDDLGSLSDAGTRKTRVINPSRTRIESYQHSSHTFCHRRIPTLPKPSRQLQPFLPQFHRLKLECLIPLYFFHSIVSNLVGPHTFHQSTSLRALACPAFQSHTSLPLPIERPELFYPVYPTVSI